MDIKVAFYILQEPSAKERALYTCRIIEKAYNNNHKIYIYTNNEEETQAMDTQLWTFSDISFVPHEIYQPNLEQEAQILVGHTAPPTTQNEILVNFTTEIMPFSKQFKHIIEVVPNDEALKALARKRFSLYKKQGYHAEVFNI